jgi:hypothetical protein
VNAPFPTPFSIVGRMEKARPDERRAVLFECARDVGRLRRTNRISPRAAARWASALQLWGERRAGLTWPDAVTLIIKGLKAAGGEQ